MVLQIYNEYFYISLNTNEQDIILCKTSKKIYKQVKKVGYCKKVLSL